MSVDGRLCRLASVEWLEESLTTACNPTANSAALMRETPAIQNYVRGG